MKTFITFHSYLRFCIQPPLYFVLDSNMDLLLKNIELLITNLDSRKNVI
jgi:hypothetical protein